MVSMSESAYLFFGHFRHGREEKQANWAYSMLNDEDMAARAFLGIFMT